MVMNMDSNSLFRIFTTRQLFTVDARGKAFNRASVLDFGDGKNPCQTPSATLGAFDMASCGFPDGAYAGQWADSLMVDEAVAVAELNSRRARLLSCDLLLIADRTPAVGLGLAFPSSALGPGVADFFSMAISNLTTAGVPATLLAQYGARQQDSKCVYVDTGGLQLYVTDTSGMFGICAALCFIAAAHGLVERYLYFKELHAVQENNQIEKEEACDRIMNGDADAAAAAAAAGGLVALPDPEAAAAASAEEAKEALREVGRREAPRASYCRADELRGLRRRAAGQTDGV